MKIKRENIAGYNDLLRNRRPAEIVQWVLALAKAPIITTNFGPYSASNLHLVSSIKPDIKVIWCDTGYNTSYTLKHSREISDQLNLNLQVYTPLQSYSPGPALSGGFPAVDDPRHQAFTEQVKLEPFRRAMKEHQPDVWFTNIRKGQTAFRDSLDILSFSQDGLLKVSPFYYYSDKDLDKYLADHNLPNERKYFDPTKALQNRECGLHN